MRPATLLLCLAMVAGSMAAINSPNDIIAANPETFSILKAVVAKADPKFASALTNGDLANTYFLPNDAAFLYDLASCWSADALSSPTTADILKKVSTMSQDNATSFIKGHVIAQSLPTVTALNTTGVAGSALTGYNLTFSLTQEPTSVTIIVVPTNDNTVFNFESAVSGAFVLGPAAIPSGSKSTTYLVDHVLADPKLITGVDCVASDLSTGASGLGGFNSTGGLNSTDMSGMVNSNMPSNMGASAPLPATKSPAPASKSPAPAAKSPAPAGGRKLFNLFW